MIFIIFRTPKCLIWKKLDQTGTRAAETFRKFNYGSYKWSNWRWQFYWNKYWRIRPSNAMVLHRGTHLFIDCDYHNWYALLILSYIHVRVYSLHILSSTAIDNSAQWQFFHYRMMKENKKIIKNIGNSKRWKRKWSCYYTIEFWAI